MQGTTNSASHTKGFFPFRVIRVFRSFLFVFLSVFPISSHAAPGNMQRVWMNDGAHQNGATCAHLNGAVQQNEADIKSATVHAHEHP
jgi:hypothetical protein